jgi:hypothetical protein
MRVVRALLDCHAPRGDEHIAQLLLDPGFEGEAVPSQKMRGNMSHQRSRILAGGLRSHELALLALVLFFFVVGARWIWLYRDGQPFDADEDAYLGIALLDYYALIRGGVFGWFSAVFGPGVQPPVATSLASLLLYFTGPHVIVAFAVPLLAGTGCVLATYVLGKSLGSRPRS